MTRPVSVTAIGNAQIDASIVKIGNGSAVFDASGDYLNTDAPLIPATGDFTIEYWYNQQTLSANRAHFQQYAAAVDGRMGMYTIQTTGQLRFYILGTDSVDISSSSNIAADIWYHIAVVRNSGTTTMYLNGASVGSSTGSIGVYQGANFQIGVTGGASSAFGNIDEFRVSSTARYTSGFAAPTAAHVNDADTLLLLHMDGTAASNTFIDDYSIIQTGSGRSAVGISAIGNAQVDTAQSKFGGASALFDGGTDDYLLVDHTAQDIAYGDDFTFEFWFRTGTLPSVFYMFATGSTRGDYIALYNKSGTWTIAAPVSNGSTVYTQIRNIGSTPSTNTWYHLALVKDGANLKMFWNGTELTTNNGSAGTMNSAYGWDGVRRIGDWQNSTNYALNGWMDEVRFSKSVRYTGSFTPATAPHSNDADTLLLLHMDGTDGSTTFLDDNGSGRSAVGISAVGSAQVDTAQSKFGGASFYADGSGDDNLVITYDQLDTDVFSDHTNTDNYTIECWIRSTNVGTTNAIFGARTSSASQGWDLEIRTNNGNGTLRWFNGNSQLYYSAGGVVSANTWHHIAAVMEGADLTVYVDGSAVITQTRTDSNPVSQDLFIGKGGFPTLNKFYGNIDEFRISNTARYTTTFTPSTTAFTSDANTLLLIHADGTDGSTVFLDDNSYFESSPAGVTHEGAADLTVSVTATASVGVTKSTSVNLSGVFSPTILAVASRNGSIDMAVQVDFASTANRFLSTDVTLANLVNLSLQAARVRPAESDLDVSFDATFAANRTRDYSSSLAVSFEQTVNATRIKEFSASIEGVFSPAIVAIASRNGSIDAGVQASLTADVAKIQQLDSALSVNANLNSTGGYLLEDSASLTVSTGLVARAIEYQLRTTSANDRPATLQYGRRSGPNWITVDETINYTTQSYEGNNAIILPSTRSLRSTRDAVNNFDIPAGTDFIFEFSVKRTGTLLNTSRTFATIGTAAESVGWSETQQVPQGFSLTSGIVFYRYNGVKVAVYNENDTGSSGYYALTASDISLNVWTTYALRRVSGTLQLYRNGVLASSVGANTRIILGANFTDNDDYAYLNAYAGQLQFDKWNFRIGESTLSTPATSSYNADNTLFHYKFENNILDSLDPITHQGAATLSSAFSATAVLGGTSNGSADLTTTASVTVAADKIVSADTAISTSATLAASATRIQQLSSDLDTVAIVSATANRTRDASASIDSAFTVSATVNVVKSASSTQDALATVDATATRIKQIDASLSAFVSSLTAAAKVGDFFVDVDLTATLDTDVNRTAGGVVNLGVQSTLSAEVVAVINTNVSLDSSASLSADVKQIIGVVADIAIVAEASATATIIKQLDAAIDSEFSATATGKTFKGTTTLLALAAVTLDCTANVTRTADAALAFTATQTASGIKAIEASATLSGVFSPSIIATANRVGEIELTAETTAVTTAVKTVSAACTAPVVVSLGATVGIVKSAEFNTAIDADLSAVGGINAVTAASLSVETAILASGGFAVLDRYVYIIPRETRVFSINSESRDFTIQRETRTYTLGEL